MYEKNVGISASWLYSNIFSVLKAFKWFRDDAQIIIKVLQLLFN